MASVLEKLQALLLLSPYDTRRSTVQEAVLMVFILNPEPAPRNLGYYAILESSDDVEYLTERARWLCQQLDVEEVEFRVRPSRKLLEIDDRAESQEIRIHNQSQPTDLKEKVERLRDQIRSRQKRLEALMETWQAAEYVPESPQHIAQLAYQLLRSHQNLAKLDRELETNRQQYQQTLTAIQQVAKVRGLETLCDWFPLLKEHLTAFEALPLAEEIIHCFEAHMASILPPPSPIASKTEFPVAAPEAVTTPAADTVLDGPAPSLSPSLYQLGQVAEAVTLPAAEVASLLTVAVSSSTDAPVATSGPVTVGSDTAELPSSAPVEVVASLPVAEVASLPVAEVASLPVAEVAPDAEIESEAEVTFPVVPETTLPEATGQVPTETGGKKKKKRKKPTH
jgi:hypothetical protein